MFARMKEFFFKKSDEKMLWTDIFFGIKVFNFVFMLYVI